MALIPWILTTAQSPTVCAVSFGFEQNQKLPNVKIFKKLLSEITIFCVHILYKNKF